MKLVKKWDIIILCALLAVATLLLCIFALIFSNQGKTVIVKVDGKEYARLDLSEDTQLLIETKNGTNLLVIKDNKAWIESASCPKQICVNHREVSELSPIVCNHNDVSITLE